MFRIECFVGTALPKQDRDSDLWTPSSLGGESKEECRIPSFKRQGRVHSPVFEM